jgi:hypothetical protein
VVRLELFENGLHNFIHGRRETTSRVKNLNISLENFEKKAVLRTIRVSNWQSVQDLTIQEYFPDRQQGSSCWSEAGPF